MANRVPGMAQGMRPAERALVAVLTAKEFVLRVADDFRPKILFPRSLHEYRQIVHAQVNLEDLARMLGARGRLRVTY